jgi:hypothetical protein
MSLRRILAPTPLASRTSFLPVWASALSVIPRPWKKPRFLWKRHSILLFKAGPAKSVCWRQWKAPKRRDDHITFYPHKDIGIYSSLLFWQVLYLRTAWMGSAPALLANLLSSAFPRPSISSVSPNTRYFPILLPVPASLHH